MIPRANITAWRERAPWPTNEQVEQDLVLSRALVSMFRRETVAEGAIFRGGTALHKLFFSGVRRYSEDIDLVQRTAEPIGKLVDEIREEIDPWLGAPQWKQSRGRFSLHYRFETSFATTVRMKVKIEINTREHFAVLPVTSVPFVVENPWFQGATKLRALYQRKKGRDLFDLWLALQHPEANCQQVVEIFLEYMARGNTPVTRAQFEKNLERKLKYKAFLEDLRHLVSQEMEYDQVQAAEMIQEELISRLPGEPWKQRAE